MFITAIISTGIFLHFVFAPGLAQKAAGFGRAEILLPGSWPTLSATGKVVIDAKFGSFGGTTPYGNCRIQVSDRSDVVKKSASLAVREECNRIERWRSMPLPIRKPVSSEFKKASRLLAPLFSVVWLRDN
jgi:hypothetical protein